MKCRGAKSANCSRCSIWLRIRSRCSVRDVVPLVDGKHQRPALLDHGAQQARVLLGDVVLRVHDDDHHVGGLDGLQGLDHAEFLDRLLDPRAAPQARRIDQRIALAVALEGHHDGIARGARLVVGDQPILAQQAIDQRALADVGAAYDRDLDAGYFGAVLRDRAVSPSSAASSSETTP